jgi:hypothetical protein
LARLDRQTELQATPAMVLGDSCAERSEPLEGKLRPAIHELAFGTCCAFRAHPHLNNVLTHISHANWPSLERSLGRILDPATTSGALSSLEQNILDLMCADRGITGRILKPYFRAVLYNLLERGRADRIIGHIQALFRELELNAGERTPTGLNG